MVCILYNISKSHDWVPEKKYVQLNVHGLLSMCLMIISLLVNLRYALVASSDLNIYHLSNKITPIK